MIEMIAPGGTHVVIGLALRCSRRSRERSELLSSQTRHRYYCRHQTVQLGLDWLLFHNLGGLVIPIVSF